MNIQRFYRLKGQVFLNESLAALTSAILFLPALIKIEKVLFLLPFILMSLYFYQMYLLNEIRSHISSKLGEGNSFVLDKRELLITFLPAPSLRMCFFDPEGCFLGEIRDRSFQTFRWFLPYFFDRKFAKEYGLFDSKKQLLFTFRFGGCNWVEVKGEKGEPFLQLKKRMKINEWILLNKDSNCQKRTIYVKSERFFTDFKIFNEHKELLARVRKGWMPIKWQQYFKDPNTPVCSFTDGLSDCEKLAIFAIMIHLYQYRNH